MTDPQAPIGAFSATPPTIESLTSLDHELILATTVCAIVEHGGELLMVRQLNRDGQPRWNFPTGWMDRSDEDGDVQLPEHVVNRNLLMETGYAASQATLVGQALVREHDAEGQRIGTSIRLNYLCGQPRQTSYAVNDPDIVAAPEWFTARRGGGADQPWRGQGRLTESAFRHWQEFRASGRLSCDLVDVPN